MHQGGGLMLWTLFKILMVVWMLQLLLRFGGSAIPLVLAMSLAALLLIIRRAFLKFGSLRDSTKTGRFNSTIAEQFAGASKINSSFHNRISKI
jgi:hypothetical protein